MADLRCPRLTPPKLRYLTETYYVAGRSLDVRRFCYSICPTCVGTVMVRAESVLWS
jgi:hypothetical protein